ncbi:unnamed protein product [Didymodactylos carnosus]|uniref:RING-type domain-containing protein n=1 Tax=Didymodactylos carnosus TaxID=1234261 RepID=A0A815Y2X9_9BILA|nr:unnamed protein product [Didymodactylos carnosus]CAF1564668.1 unnamed protein product [Didymodactylos carnosus]CAF3739297.1 unnamed protein product [Didymodactylos carnosus]CAF4426631.1 unnamed protein product [Didymodactylos carnosus]
MTLEKCIKANKEHQKIVNILGKVKNVIFGDLDTSKKYTSTNKNDPPPPPQVIEWLEGEQHRQRSAFMKQMLAQIDGTDNQILELDKNWVEYYWAKFTALLGYCIEKLFQKPNELSKLYKLAAGLKKSIPVTIYYEACSICLDLIIEVVDQDPRACITKCGHIFHYDCLKRAFEQQKRCPNCRRDLRSLPEKATAKVIGLKEVQNPLKANVS